MPNSTNSSKLHFLILSVTLLLLLLLPLAKPTTIRNPFTYCGFDDYANPYSDQDYAIWIVSFNEELYVEPVSFNVTALLTKQLIRSAKVNLTLAGVTTKHRLCDMTFGGCPIRPGQFTFTFNRTFKGVKDDGKFSIVSKNNTVLTCVIFAAATAEALPEPPPAPEPPSL